MCDGCAEVAERIKEHRADQECKHDWILGPRKLLDRSPGHRIGLDCGTVEQLP